jgi:hypothetical protein
MSRPIITKETFLKKAIEKHGDKYDYSKVEIKSTKEDISIICKVHGEFYQGIWNHLMGKGCFECSKIIRGLKRRNTLDEFVILSHKVHGNKYDYSKSKYLGAYIKTIIICPVHGEFMQDPHHHMNHGNGCTECGIESIKYKQSKTNEQFVIDANRVHNNYYSYKKCKYINHADKVIITCPKHGDFLQSPNVHLDNSGCPKCKIPMGEKAIRKFLDQHKIEYEIQKMYENLKGNKG